MNLPVSIKSLILFGSRAKGYAVESSDTDVAVLADQPLSDEDRSAVIQFVVAQLKQSEDKIDLIIPVPADGEIFKLTFTDPVDPLGLVLADDWATTDTIEYWKYEGAQIERGQTAQFKLITLKEANTAGILSTLIILRRPVTHKFTSTFLKSVMIRFIWYPATPPVPLI